jgi:hypothetical protein
MPESSPVSGSEDREISAATKTFVFAFRESAPVYLLENLSGLRAKMITFFEDCILSQKWIKTFRVITTYLDYRSKSLLKKRWQV